MIEFNGHFDGERICPDEPVSLPKDVPLRVTVNPAIGSRRLDAPRNPAELFDEMVADCGLIDGPDDWSTEHDHYLYGALKKSHGSAE